MQYIIGVYTSSTDIDEVVPTTSTTPHTSTITSVSITGLATSASDSPPLNQQLAGNIDP